MALQDNLDSIINPLIKSLIAKKTVDAKDIDAVLNITIQKVVHSINALAITLFVVAKDDRIHFSKVYYSNVLYEGDEELEKAFREKLMTYREYSDLKDIVRKFKQFATEFRG